MGAIRIVAGTLRGRKIAVPRDARVRPTPDRVREALFNRLGQILTGLRVLDAFAGSGALGFEAASRGAAKVAFIEADPTVAASLRLTAEALGVEDRVVVVCGDAAASLRRARDLAGPFDVVLADPPFQAPREGFLAAVGAPAFLPRGARVVVEREAKAAIPAAPPGLRFVREARYGRVALDFFEAVGP